jgi:type II secretory pathway component PulM
MAAERLSRLQRRILAHVYTVEARSRGMLAASHVELVQAVGGNKGNVSIS